jgi:hypothetical protein
MGRHLADVCEDAVTSYGMVCLQLALGSALAILAGVLAECATHDEPRDAAVELQ